MRWLSHIFNHTDAWIYLAACYLMRFLLSYWINIWLIDVIQGFCYNTAIQYYLTLETESYLLHCILVLQANQLTKCASHHPKWFWPDYIYIASQENKKHKKKLPLENLKVLEQRKWLKNLSETGRRQLANFFKVFHSIGFWLIAICNLLLNFLFRFGYQAEQT